MKNNNKKQKYINTSNVVKVNSYSSFGSLSLKTTPEYTYKGTKNKTSFPDFIKLCKATQKDLKKILPKKLTEAGYTDVVVDDGFIYAKGDIPILLTAHMDTVHKDPVKDFYEYVDKDGNHIISSPQGIGGDDRCGIYMILEIIKEFKPSILFCEDEEIGGVGSNKFCKTEFINELADLKFLIELDRANGNDAVFYDCDNPEFTKFIEEVTGYKEAYGSFSDISNLAPDCRVAAVNLSCGYYNAHTLHEEVNVEEMLNTIKVVKKLLTVESKQYEYIEVDLGWEDGFGYGYCYGGYAKKPNSRIYSVTMLYTIYIDNKGKEHDGYAEGETEEEAWVNFFFEHPNVCFNQVIDYDFDYM